MKKILIADWLDKYGGAERVITSFCSIFTFQKCYVLTNVMNSSDIEKTFSGQRIPVKQTILKHVGSKFRYFLLFFPYLARNIKIPKDIDVFISSSHAVAKGVRKSKSTQIHISYFQARNLKYIWSEKELYFGKYHKMLSPILKWMQKKDVEDAQNPDYIIANSEFVKEWVKKTYDRNSYVIYPPVDLSNFPLQVQKEDYYVAVGRLEPYKRFDLVVEAFNKTKKKLIVIGDGSQLNTLKKIAKKNIQFIGFVPSKEVYKYISRAKGFVHAGVEDFGIAPIEAQSCGTPVIALGKGGILETVIENKTGIFFKKETAESIVKVLRKFDKITFDPQEIHQNAQRFNKNRFENKMEEFVNEKIQENFNGRNLACLQ